MYTKIVILLAIIIFVIRPAKGQTMAEYEQQIAMLMNGIAVAPTDEAKRQQNEVLVAVFDQMLTNDDSFNYPFDSLQYMGKQKTTDGCLRIYNWNLAFIDGTYKYFGYLQYYIKPKDKFVVHKLTDQARSLEKPNVEVLTPDNWWGALYYDIITHKSGSRVYYTLLGWDGNDMMTNKKVIETLYFNSMGVAKFGAPIIKANRNTYKRIVFEYSNRATMTLKYFAKDKCIVLDHLSPAEPKYEGLKQYYGPDFSYDSFVLKKGKWLYETDVDFKAPRNTFNKKGKIKTGL